jgi:predicted amidohydrolase
MKLALITMQPKIADKNSNLNKMIKYIQKTKADIYVFGEMTLTGYPLKDKLSDLSEDIDGSSIRLLKTIAEKNQCYIVFGLPTCDDNVKGLIYNSAIMIHPTGEVDYYNKWFLVSFGPFEEKIFFDEGETLTLCNTKFGKIGLIICYDIFFPELCRAYSMMGAEMVICISASPSVTRKYFETIFPARAIENTIFFVYSNVVGTQENLVFWGGSQVYDPLSNQLIKAPYFKESIVTCDIDFEQIASARANRPVLRDIRPQIYDDLYEISRTHQKPNKRI